MRVIRIAICFFIVCSISCDAQNIVSEDIAFLVHLSENNLVPELESEAQSLLQQSTNEQQKDSICFLVGKVFQAEKNDTKAIQYYSKIHATSIFYNYAQFYKSFLLAKNKNIDSAEIVIKSIETDTAGILFDLKNLQLTACAILRCDGNNIIPISSFNSKDSLLLQEQQNLSMYAFQKKQLYCKSPIMAGALSTVIPGLGKAYAGNNGEALAFFLRVGVLGASTTENIIKLGLFYPQSIVLAGVFGAYYIGNIWGSSLSVQRVKNEKIKEINHNTMVSLQLALQHVFNQQ